MASGQIRRLHIVRIPLFINRQKELDDLKKLFQSSPNSIVFVYGPKSCGKTTLMLKAYEELSETHPQKFTFYWFDLRTKFISGYDSIIDLFFSTTDIKERTAKGAQERIAVDLKVFHVEKTRWEELKARRLDPFDLMMDEIRRDVEKGRRVNIVFDELQRLRDVYVAENRNLIDELFDFFIALSKVYHFANVFVATSDTFFIEEIWTRSRLEGSAHYFKVEWLDESEVRNFLIENGLSEGEADLVIEKIGGHPWALSELLGHVKGGKKVQEFVQQMLELAKAKVRTLLLFSDETAENREDVKRVLSLFVDRDSVEIGSLDEPSLYTPTIKFLCSKELLFYDPLDGKLMPSTKPILHAIREVLG